MITVKYKLGNEEFSLNCQEGDKRTKLIQAKNGTQQGKVATFFEIATLLSPELVVDVGSNYGEFLLPFMKTEYEIKAYEPNENVFACLSETFSKNNNIELNNCCVLDEDGEAILFIPESSGNASLNKKFLTGPSKLNQKVKQVDVLSIVKDRNTFLMKIDIEGLEENILKRIFDNKEFFQSFCIFFEANRFSQNNQSLFEILEGNMVCSFNNSERGVEDLKIFKFDKKSGHKRVSRAHDIFVFYGGWGEILKNIINSRG